MKNYYDETSNCWRNENGGRMCTIDNDTLNVVIDNCKEFLNDRDTIYLGDVKVLLEKALEGVKDKNDLVDSEKETIKKIREMIKGL